MTTFNIMLNSINEVKNFVNIVNKYSCDIDLTSGRYVVDAKSIMGPNRLRSISLVTTAAI